MSADKAPDAFRTISEAAAELGLEQHVLRFWETRFAQIKPLKRGGGRRYYRPDDVDFLRGLKRLLHDEKYTIKGVQKIIREQGAKAVAAVGRGADAPGSGQPPAERAPGIEGPASAARIAADAPRRALLEQALAELAAARRILRAA